MWSPIDPINALMGSIGSNPRTGAGRALAAHGERKQQKHIYIYIYIYICMYIYIYIYRHTYIYIYPVLQSAKNTGCNIVAGRQRKMRLSRPTPPSILRSGPCGADWTLHPWASRLGGGRPHDLARLENVLLYDYISFPTPTWCTRRPKSSSVIPNSAEPKQFGTEVLS